MNDQSPKPSYSSLVKRIMPIYISSRFLLPVCLFFLVFGLNGQNSISIKASATVVEVAGIDLITLKDMVVDEASADSKIINISPLTDEKAGKMLVRGKANLSIRLTYVKDLFLMNTAGEGSIVVRYNVSGNKTDNQRASQPLDQVERIVQFNEKGEYYLWLGGQIDLSNSRPGNYDGEFTIQIEYI